MEGAWWIAGHGNLSSPRVPALPTACRVAHMGDSTESKHSLITCFPARGKAATMPFIGFAEAFVLASFRRAGLPLQRVCPAVEALA